MEKSLTTGYRGVEIGVRPMELADLDAVMAVHLDPRVRPSQYRVSSSYRQKLQRLIEHRIQNPEFELAFRMYTVTRDGQPIGDIIVQVDSHLTVGWNLCPEFWGQGYMPAALELFFHRVFKNHEDAQVVSNCFSDNTRCMRMMEKLGFQPAKINLFERFWIVVFAQSLKRHKRYRLNKTAFDQRAPPSRRSVSPRL